MLPPQKLTPFPSPSIMRSRLCAQFHPQRLLPKSICPNFPSLGRFHYNYSPSPLILSSAPRLLSALSDGGTQETRDTGKTPDSDSEVVVDYLHIDEVERLEGYCPGEFHPVVIGDYLHDRYRIVGKLGFGGSSTIWLASDHHKAGRYVAVKICVAQGNDDSQESDILHRLVVGRPDPGDEAEHPGKAIIRTILDEFLLDGPNGQHRCIVTVPASISLDGAQDASNITLFQLPVARAIVAQLVQAVAFLHSNGIVHADLHPGNILLRLPKSIDGLSIDQLYEEYGPPFGEPVERLDNQPLPKGVPTHGILPLSLGENAELIPLSEASIFLTDFGESFVPSSTTPRYDLGTPDLYAPPEVYFFSPQEPQPVSFPVDIWTLACTIWTILGQRPLFEAFNPSADLMIAEHVDVLGKLPPEWWEKWEARPEWFDEDGVRQRHYGGEAEEGRPWEVRFEYSVQEPRRECGMEQIGEEEKIALFVMLKAMLAFRPRDRLSVENVLDSEWMRKWALPELERMREITIVPRDA